MSIPMYYSRIYDRVIFMKKCWGGGGGVEMMKELFVPRVPGNVNYLTILSRAITCNLETQM